MILSKQEIDTLGNQLRNIHSRLNFFPSRSDLLGELPEQLMAIKYLKDDDCVLELGGSLGRNSCVINSVLKNKSNQVVVEPSKQELVTLAQNRDVNNLGFHIENTAICDHELLIDDWLSPLAVQPKLKVDTITFDNFKEKYPLNFNVLIIDCEGHIVDMMKSFPNILDNIRLLIIEHDFTSEEDLKWFNNHMTENNYVMDSVINKESSIGPGMDWPWGVLTDEIFVSAWIKK